MDVLTRLEDLLLLTVKRERHQEAQGKHNEDNDRYQKRRRVGFCAFKRPSETSRHCITMQKLVDNLPSTSNSKLLAWGHGSKQSIGAMVNLYIPEESGFSKLTVVRSPDL